MLRSPNGSMGSTCRAALKVRSRPGADGGRQPRAIEVGRGGCPRSDAIDWGPGYRILLWPGWQANSVVLLAGGTKKRQRDRHKVEPKNIGRNIGERKEGARRSMAPDEKLQGDGEGTCASAIPTFASACCGRRLRLSFATRSTSGKSCFATTINATVGFADLAGATHKNPKSLMRHAECRRESAGRQPVLSHRAAPESRGHRARCV